MLYKKINKIAPKISVLMSVYNGSHYLRESIESILNQTFRDFEFIIIDDCSTDKSWKIITEYSEQDERIILVKNQENLGLTKSLNKGLKIARGEYIARQDADDISLLERLEKELIFLDEHPDVALVSCNLEIINSEGFTIDKWQLACDSNLVAWYLLFYNRLGGHSQFLFRKEVILNLGGYCETFRYSQDYELLCRLAKVGKIAIIPEFLLKYRMHNQAISMHKKLEQEACTLTQVRHNIQELIGEEVTLDEAKNLMHFWTGNAHWWPEQFPNSRKVGNIHYRLTQIYQIFIKKYSIQNDFHTDEISSNMKTLIGKQFLYWIQSPFNKNNGLIAKLKISFYAYFWYPLGIPKSWCIGLIKLPFYMKQQIKLTLISLIKYVLLRNKYNS
ncbi:glycosyl transferase family protein [Calothrix sp. NIES-2098]|nr:glycosyl transferase family protein [Calothrix sp. NIES-2098]